MANKTLTVIAKVKDASSASLKKIKGGFDNTNKSIKQTKVDLTEFNRIMFSTTAFVGFFTRQFSMLGDSLVKAGELDRLSTQFEKVLGPRGDLFSQINSLTNNTIDRMEAMRAGVALQATGVSGDVKQIAQIVARAGTAAKRAGLSSAEGIKKVVDFMKEGSVSSLSFLNVLTPTNVQLQAQMAVLQKAGGIYGNVLSTQAKLRIGMAALKAATGGMGNETKDLSDTIQELSQSFAFLKGESSLFLGKALTPIFEKFTQVSDAITSFMERIKTSEKTMVQTVKNIVIVTSAFAGLIATVGTGRLLFKALGALGMGGIPFLAFSLLGLAAAFGNVEKSIEPFTKGLKAIGGIGVGVFQLISSFLQDADNFKKGIGKMDSGLHEFLRKQGLLELTTNIARGAAAIISFVNDAGGTLIKWVKDLGDLLSPIGKMFSKFFSDSDPKGWSRSWIEAGNPIRDTLVFITAAATGLYAAFKLLSIGKGILGKLPIIGSLFGGGRAGKGPEGSARDPLYVVFAKGVERFFGSSKTTTPEIPTAAVPSSLGKMANLGLFVSAVGAAAGAGILLGQTLNELDATFGGPVAGLLDKIINATANMFSLSGSQAEQQRINDLMKTREYTAIINTYRKLGKPISTDEAISKTEQLVSESQRIAALKQFGPGHAADYSEQYKLEVSPKNKEAAFAEALNKMQIQATAPKIDRFSMPMQMTEFGKMERLKEVMSTLDQNAQKKMQSAINAAISGTSAGGKVITPEEWRAIMTEALNASQVNENTKKTANKPDQPNLAKTHRC